jgi:hypothetical protein
VKFIDGRQILWRQVVEICACGQQAVQNGLQETGLAVVSGNAAFQIRRHGACPRQRVCSRVRL